MDQRHRAGMGRRDVEEAGPAAAPEEAAPGRGETGHEQNPIVASTAFFQAAYFSALTLSSICG
ncbi:hypothetical protein AB9K41_25025, partial [Cribrihabitans sp. XS_ASV171]